jgi:hypothetical protein
MAIVADFDSCPQRNDEVKAVYALARYDAGCPGQRRLDTVIRGIEPRTSRRVYCWAICRPRTARARQIGTTPDWSRCSR